MADVVRLTVVASQGEADVICSVLRANSILCGDRSLAPSVGGGALARSGGWREVFVNEDDLGAARELLAAPPLPEEDEGAG